MRPSKPSSGEPAPNNFVRTNSTGLQTRPVGSRPVFKPSNRLNSIPSPCGEHPGRRRGSKKAIEDDTRIEPNSQAAKGFLQSENAARCRLRPPRGLAIWDADNLEPAPTLTPDPAPVGPPGNSQIRRRRPAGRVSTESPQEPPRTPGAAGTARQDPHGDDTGGRDNSLSRLRSSTRLLNNQSNQLTGTPTERRCS